ncbi:NAD(P)H-binding protein [Actinoplanes sp. NPDC049596]|uniref:NmrA family NAD(P)-binding protein n=1 Tax=unclassified Actinoplanes TaxID=2626549 RepID=UPI00341BA67B
MIVVTGATGRLGGRVVQRLNAPLRLLVRDASRAPAGFDAAVATYDDGDAVRRALTSGDTVLMVSAAETPDRVAEHLSFVDAAAAAGIGHLVYISFAGASPDATFTLARDHWATEQHIRASGLPFTFLRDNLYADFLPFMVGDDGVIRGPAADGRAAVVAQDDIADAAAAVLADPAPHAGHTYTLTGPAALTLTEAAEILTAAGHPARFQNETVPEAYESRRKYNAPDWQLDAWISTYTAIAAGDLAEVTPDIPTLTGHPATSLATLLTHQ